MRYNSKSSIGNAKKAERNDELDHLVRSINMQTEDIGSAVDRPKEQKAHEVEYPKSLKVIARGIEGAVLGSLLVAGGIIAKDAGVSAYKSVERVREMSYTLSKAMAKPYQSTGIVATTGSRTNDVFGTIYLDSADGTSYHYNDGKISPNHVPAVHQFSIPLSTYIKVVSKNGDQILSVQNVLEVKRSYRDSIVYVDTSEVYKLPSASILKAAERGIEDAFVKSPPINNPTHFMKGNGYQGYYGNKRWNVYYVYNMYPQEANFPVGIGLDITAKKEGDDVVIKFGQFPAEKGMIYRERMHVFDRVTYHVNGLEKVYMIFNNRYNTGLTISGYGDHDVVKSKNLDGLLTLYEMHNKKTDPLILSSTKEWDESSGAYNVRAEGTGNYVIVTTAPAKSK